MIKMILKKSYESYIKIKNKKDRNKEINWKLYLQEL